MKFSIIIPTMKGREDKLKKLLDTIDKEHQIIIVNDENLLLAAKRNKGAKEAKHNYLLFIDDDNYLADDALWKIQTMMEKSIGVMGLTACYHNKKRIIADGGSFRFFTSGLMWGQRTNENIEKYNWFGVGNRKQDYYPVDEVANAFVIPKKVFEDVGGFDEVNFPIDMDEADICKRIKNMGYEVVVNPYAICYHDSQTYSNIPDFRRPMNCYFMARNKVLFQKKHLNKIQLFIYFMIFFPMFIVGYTVCLLYRGKPNMVLEYWRGSLDGILNRKKNKYQ